MTDDTRREFLTRLAKTAAYSAPVVLSLAAPVELVAQGSSSVHKGMMASAFDSEPTSKQPDNDAPWNEPPPGDRLESPRERP
jgi:hypothetical protein